MAHALPPDTADAVPASFSADHLSGQVILITGAGGGLGQALAIAVAECGGTPVLLGRTVSKLEATDDAIRAIGGTAALETTWIEQILDVDLDDRPGLTQVAG